MTGAPVYQASQVGRAEVEDFLFEEAALLDQWRLDEWLELFTEDGGYYVPSPDLPNGRPETTLYLVADDMARLQSRVSQMLGRFAWAENPPSRTRRLVGNVRVRGAEGNTLRISANFAVYRTRHELVDTYIGRYEYRLVVGGSRPVSRLKIQERRAILDLESLRPHGKLSIIL